MRHLNDLSVLVTGGSRGLGLLLARQCVERGWNVTITARDQEELDRAAALLRRRAGRRGTTVAARVCDVRDKYAVRDVVARTAEDQRGLDVVLGNAGIIQVGPAEATGEEGFRGAMETMFFGALHTSLESLPHLRKSSVGGRLGLIGSVGGLLPVPHLLPYACAKSAIGALAEGLRAEQAEYGVSVTAAHPGLMRTGSHLQAEFGGDAAREYAWFATLAGMPLVTMSAPRAAERIVDAVERRRTRVVLTPAARLGATAYGMAPTLVTRANCLVARLLPDSQEKEGATVKGHGLAQDENAARPRWQSAISALNERASRRFNETARQGT
ncbi:SDR family NAD(P)-dependent oxidoreductase [Streptomyces iconiensis]|uniref:SDR family NAD(P)-dependent oxidoreductase n=1 Tax=Streptomyces iconiensis TaxID=1384038 RepID=A0ABT6ZR23_9ACTN|nr:SDR family NAD(P)-dependent oxidoreductase [Streptomyces iconiensis]MDJ1130978.1 SDR family NAD(P)-dependent oxidoreductase [Streptomyces iconiensis]